MRCVHNSDHMSKLKELIDRLCPNGVEYLKLDPYIEIYTGEQFNKRDMNAEGSYPVINGGLNPSGYIESYNEPKDTISISQGGASAGYVAWQDSPFWAGAHCYVVRPVSKHLLNRFLFFFLKNQEVYLQQMQHGAGIPALNREKVKNLLIPVPPIEVQEEIVRILDTFSAHAAELQAELQARKEQYEYYRNLLLTFNPSACGCGTDDEQEIFEDILGKENTPPHLLKHVKVTWKTMGEIGKFIRGNGLQKKDFTDSGVGCIHYGQIYTHYGTFASETKSFVNPKLAERLLRVAPGDIILACTSENVEDVGKAVAWLGNENIVTGGHSVVFKHSENPKYIAYFLQTQSFFQQKKKYAYGAKVIDIKTEDLAKIQIPIPPLELQKKIASILDRFETLVNDLTQGLPAEIVAVKERYDYYRNKLLTFKKLSA